MSCYLKCGEEARKSGRDIESPPLTLSLLLFSSFVTRETSELEKEPESFNTDFQRVLV